MIPLEPRQEKELIKSRLFAWLMGVIAPVLYLIVAGVIKIEPKTGREIELFLYLLVIIAIVQPALFYLIQRYQISMYRKNTNTTMSAAQLYSTLALIKMSFVDAVYLYGLVVFILTGDQLKMLWFYPIGAVWLFIYWPRHERFEKFIRENKHNGH